MALAATVAAAASAYAASGGVGSSGGSGQSASGCAKASFGDRKLRRGDCGADVKTLNWILKSKRAGRAAPLGKRFRRGTERSVRKMQRKLDVRRSGVVDRRTRRSLARTMRKDLATWYGPGFYGNRTACGRKLRRKTVGVAHKRLPCGTRVTLRYKGRYLRTRVIDRGPYAHGARWDLTNGAAKKLRFKATDRVRSAIVR